MRVKDIINKQVFGVDPDPLRTDREFFEKNHRRNNYIRPPYSGEWEQYELDCHARGISTPDLIKAREYMDDPRRAVLVRQVQPGQRMRIFGLIPATITDSEETAAFIFDSYFAPLRRGRGITEDELRSMQKTLETNKSSWKGLGNA